MAGQPRNLEQGVQGSTIDLDVRFHQYSGGPLTDPDNPPTFVIYRPDNSVAFNGTGTFISTGYYVANYPIPINAPTGNRWRIVWTASVNGVPVPDSWEYFTVLPQGSSSFFNIPIISQQDLFEIKKVLAFPAVPSVLLSDEEIKLFCVREGLHRYFTKFPIRESEEMEIYRTLEVDFPDQWTYGVIEARIVDKLVSGSGRGGSFWDLVKYRGIWGNQATRFGGAFGTRYNFNNIADTYFSRKLVWDTLSNESTLSYEVDYTNKKLIVYSSIDAKLLITWAKESINFNDVNYVYKYDVIELCQAKLLRHLADTGSIVSDSTLEKNVNSDALNSRADAIEERIREKWDSIPDIILMRGR